MGITCCTLRRHAADSRARRSNGDSDLEQQAGGAAAGSGVAASRQRRRRRGDPVPGCVFCSIAAGTEEASVVHRVSCRSYLHVRSVAHTGFLRPAAATRPRPAHPAVFFLNPRPRAYSFFLSFFPRSPTAHPTCCAAGLEVCGVPRPRTCSHSAPPGMSAGRQHALRGPDLCRGGGLASCARASVCRFAKLLGPPPNPAAPDMGFPGWRLPAHACSFPAHASQHCGGPGLPATCIHASISTSSVSLSPPTRRSSPCSTSTT